MQISKIIPLIPTQAVPDTMPSLPATWPKNAPSSFHVLAKPSGATCNLDCTYCFFLSKEKLYPNSRFRMSDETLETYIRQVIESQRAPEVTISWQGGDERSFGAMSSTRLNTGNLSHRSRSPLGGSGSLR